MVKRRVGRILLVTLLVLIALGASLTWALQRPSFQTFLAQKATQFLSYKLNTKVEIEAVELHLFRTASFKNFYMQDLFGDTAIYAHQLDVKFGIVALLDKRFDIQTIALDGAKVYLHRDSTGTITNLAQLFKSSVAKDTSASKPFDWDIHLDALNLTNTNFSYLDEKSKLDLRVFVPELDVSVKQADFKKMLIALNSVTLKQPRVSIDMGKRSINDDNDTSGPIHFMPGNMVVTYDEFNLEQAHFSLNDHNVDTVKAKGMDFKHLDITDIFLIASDGAVTADTITTQIAKLSAKDRCGFELKNLSGKAQVSTTDITVEGMEILTPNSRIQNYFSLQYAHFRDFKDFLNKVRIKASLGDTKVALADLAHFVPGISVVGHNTLSVSGNIDGRINNLKGRGLNVRTGKGTVFAGNFYMRGLPQIFETSIHLKVDRMTTNAADISRIYPALKLPANIATLGDVKYSGTIDGFVTDMVMNGKLQTEIGDANADLNFKYDKKRNKAQYSGNLALNEFYLGKFLNDTVNLGKVTLNTAIVGKGITPESLEAKIDGKVTSIELMKHSYRDLVLHGDVIKKSFTGSIEIRDPALDMDFKGSVNLQTGVPNFNFSSVIRKAQLKELNLSKVDFSLKGSMEGDFSGAKIDEIIGKLQLHNFQFSRDTATALIRETDLQVYQQADGTKDFSLTSDYADVYVKGAFTFKKLPQAVKNFINYTFFKIAPDSITTPQNFTADIRIRDLGDLAHVIHPQLHSLSSASLQGSFSSANNATTLNVSVPSLKFGDYTVRKIAVENTSGNGQFFFNAFVDEVYQKDSLMVDTLQAGVKTTGNDFVFDMSVYGKNKNIYGITSAKVTPQTGYASVTIAPSEFKLGNNIWRFAPGNLLEVAGRRITSRGLIFQTTDQRLFVDAYLKNDTSTSVRLTLDNTSISDFTGIFTTKVKDIKGAVNGKLTVEDIFYKPRIYADFVADEVKLGDELVGDVNIESRLDDQNKRINVLATVKSVANNIDASGYISIDPQHPGINIKVDAKRIGLNFLNYRFFDKYVKKVSGYASADLLVSGTTQLPLLTGECRLNKANVTVSYLNTNYHLRNQVVKLDEHGFYIPGLTGYDHRDSSFYGTGRINHESFRNFNFDLVVTTDNAQFLNTTVKEMPSFYGVAYGKGRITFKGPVNLMNISARAETKSGTHCYLPIRPSYETNSYSFYKFVNPKADTISTKKPKEIVKPSGVSFTLDLDATPDATIDILLDPAAGDILTGVGRGSLQIQIPRNGNISMLGDYEIVNGSYLFTLQNIINKRFDINKGSRVKFTGDIYKAALDVDAIYEVRTSTYDLIQDLIIGNTTSSSTTTTGESQLVSAAKSRIPTKLMLKLTGVLEKPIVGFDIKVVDPDPAVKTYVDQRLNILKSNENEMNNQVFGLLVMNRFLPPSTSATNALTNTTYLTGTAANTVSEFLSSQLSNYLSNLLDFANVKNLNIDIGYRQYDQSNNTTNGGTQQSTYDTRRELQLALTQSLLNNRLTLNAGGNLDFGNSASVGSGQNNGRAVIPTGDFQIEYALTKDGVWRAKAFNRTNYDYYNSRNNNKTGIGISYRQEFDRPSELLRKRAPKKKKTTPPEVPPADVPQSEE